MCDNVVKWITFVPSLNFSLCLSGFFMVLWLPPTDWVRFIRDSNLSMGVDVGVSGFLWLYVGPTI